MASQPRDEVEVRFHQYERALMGDDLDKVRDFFVADAHRFGPASTQRSADEIDRERRTNRYPMARSLLSTEMRVLGDFVVIAIAEFMRTESGQRGRQTQVWIRDRGTWRISHAHVSMIAIDEGSHGAPATLSPHAG